MPSPPKTPVSAAASSAAIQAAAVSNGSGQPQQLPTNSQSAAPIPGKPVELDNAGRVKSGKVRKQCELCGQWSNIKWFFKHMSEVHQVNLLTYVGAFSSLWVNLQLHNYFCIYWHFD